MHFWIDKRSPQCGFGRSRVAASLSGAGGGAGVSFGHPPRRTGGNKSTGAGVHRQHHQQSHQSSAQYHQHGVSGAGASSASASGVSGNYAAGSTPASNTNFRSPNYPSTSSSATTHSNNNNNSHTVGAGSATHTPTNRNHLRANNAHHYYNNNRQFQQQQNSSNNNQAATTTATIVVQNNVTSPTGNNVNASAYGTQTLPSTTQPTSHHLQQQNPYQQQRYRHPQFGNMSVRTYPSSAVAVTQPQTSGPTHNSNVIQQPPQSVDSTLNALSEGSLQHQSLNQTANITAELYQSSPRVVTVFPRPLSSSMPATCDHNNSTTNTTATGSIAPTTMRAIYGSTSTALHGNTRRRNMTRSIESADLQFLPLHLKCGIFASLVLAIAFIVGIKVYFDNHGTKFEVGLFWLLTATFVFAFCFVSICKVPRVLFATSSSSSRSGSRDQTVRDRCSMEDARGSIANSVDDVVLNSLQEFQQQEIIEQQINQATQAQQQAGPPPYHIAILLPESKAKEEAEPVEESPPPSYDKILI